MCSDTEYAVLLRGDPEEIGRLPEYLRPTWDLGAVRAAAARIRRELRIPGGSCCWDALAAVYRLERPCIYSSVGPSGGECVVDGKIVLSGKARGWQAQWQPGHGLVHIDLIDRRVEHSEGDVVLTTAEVFVPGETWRSKSVRRMLRLIRGLSPKMQFAWASRHLDHAQLSLVFAKEVQRDPEERRREEAEIIERTDISHLLGELTSIDPPPDQRLLRND